MKVPDTYMIARGLIDGYMKILADQDKMLLKVKKAGALALLSSNGRDGTVTVQAFTGYKTGSPEGLPQAVISGVDGLKIKRLIASGHTVELSLNIKGKFYSDDTKGYNVVAEIPGSDPKLKAQLVMLGGHMDSWNAGTGATDNGAGCIVMMEAVRLLDSLHLQPKRTVRIVLWGGEEEGLLGSYGYVKKHFGNAETGEVKPEQARVSAYFNLDNGTGKIRGIFAQNNEQVKPIFEQWLQPFHDLGAQTVTMSNTGSTDHLSFDWVGIPGFQFIQDPLDYETKTHHTNMDTYDYLQMDDLKQASIIVASFVYQAANRPDMLPRKPIKKEKFVFDGL
jgi:Zn-dependent M28 family amino/carboxypeptidase